jgi:hypothetical protein
LMSREILNNLYLYEILSQFAYYAFYTLIYSKDLAIYFYFQFIGFSAKHAKTVNLLGSGPTLGRNHPCTFIRSFDFVRS